MKKYLLVSIKIVVATMLSIVVAQMMNLINPLSAGIIAILSILETRKITFKKSIQRILSSLLALVIAAICFSVFGYNLSALALFLLVYSLMAYILKIEVGITPSMVLVTHLLIAKDTSISFLFNELLLMVIGSLFANICNIYMLNNHHKLSEIKKNIEQLEKKILYTFEILLVEPDYNHHLDEDLKLLNDLCNEGRGFAKEDLDNSLLNEDRYNDNYFKMRAKQYAVLNKIYVNLIYINEPIIEAQKIAEVMHIIAMQLHEDNDCRALIADCDALYTHYAHTKLPKTRDEFEKRAILFQILNEMSLFLAYKNEFIVNDR
ncbi:MAG: aromatic acid exporter family protein [Erysipelotrichaceae bacterium]|nr:aromatic acid exporter family protein [Erysipelotrichaceae bacterium]